MDIEKSNVATMVGKQSQELMIVLYKKVNLELDSQIMKIAPYFNMPQNSSCKATLALPKQLYSFSGAVISGTLAPQKCGAEFSSTPPYILRRPVTVSSPEPRK